MKRLYSIALDCEAFDFPPQDNPESEGAVRVLSDLAAGCFANLALTSAVTRPKLNQTVWRFDWLMTDAPGQADLDICFSLACETHNLALPARREWTITPIDTDTDWLSLSYRQFAPFQLGPFFIHGSHYTDKLPDGLTGLQIDAATAFGSGEHETTAGCLEAMAALHQDGFCPWNVLDMGTGSGILALAAWKLWRTPVLAVDNDPEAVRMTEHHLRLNSVRISETSVRCLYSEGFADPKISVAGPYELITANILAGPLRTMAGPLVEALDSNGIVILSGILNEQAQSVSETYKACGLRDIDAIRKTEWTTLVLKKN